MGINTIGIAFSSRINDLKEITNKLNILIEGPIEECYFEDAISNNINDNEVFITQLENGTLITVGDAFPFFEDDFSILSESAQRFTKFIYGETSSQYCFDYYENNKFVRSKYISEGSVVISEGTSLPQEFSGLTDDELILSVVEQTCGEDFFSIDHGIKTLKYRYKSGKPLPKNKTKLTEFTKVEDQLNSKPVSKNRIVFFLVLVHIFLGIANMISSNIFLNRPFHLQITNYVTLMIFGVMGYFILKRKNWMRIIFIVCYFISIPLSLFSLN